MKNFRLLPILAVLFLYGCTETATIKVQNLVHNATLESINYGDYALAYTLIPGKTSDERTISDYPEYWPKNEKIEFYMVRDGNMVYLKTTASYLLNPGDELFIVIADTTEVESPFGKKATMAEVLGRESIVP